MKKRIVRYTGKILSIGEEWVSISIDEGAEEEYREIIIDVKKTKLVKSNIALRVGEFFNYEAERETGNMLIGTFTPIPKRKVTYPEKLRREILAKSYRQPMTKA